MLIAGGRLVRAASRSRWSGWRAGRRCSSSRCPARGRAPLLFLEVPGEGPDTVLTHQAVTSTIRRILATMLILYRIRGLPGMQGILYRMHSLSVPCKMLHGTEYMVN